MLETERLIMRRITPADLEALVETRKGDEENKYLGGNRMQNPEAIARRMQFYMECHEKYGFGMCMMIWKETGETIGWCGLQPLEETGEIEVGYGMKKEFWRRGIGYECAMAWLRYGFETVGAERIVALAHPDNVGSWRIMEKCGMHYEKNMVHFDMECVVYAITKDEFLRSSGK
jgi:ribosomal-protein-alanine N-acetyltransferase